MTALQIELVPCLKDNYAYLVHDAQAGLTAIVDPSEPEPVKEALARHGWRLTHILNTHHHFDHTGGNVPLKDAFGAQVVGPEKDRERIPGIDAGVVEGEAWSFGARRVPVLEIPAHTRAHIAFVFDEYGDFQGLVTLTDIMTAVAGELPQEHKQTPQELLRRDDGSWLIDGEPAGSLQTPFGFHNLISWSGLDIGRDRSSPVSHYTAPFEFTGRLLKVTVDMHDDQKLDGDGIGAAEMARQ